ncbi:MAG: NAD-dependent epimerase/dehydratase family protein, partial [Nocardioidaceae bacterium]
MRETVCVTGGLGFVGTRLCAALNERGYGVICVDRLSGRYAHGTGADAARRFTSRPRMQVVVADLGRLDLDRELARAGAVVHLAALPGVRARHPRASLMADNVRATERLVDWAGRHGRRLVLASSSSVYGDAGRGPTSEHAPKAPRSPYAASKLAAERACLDAARGEGVDAVIARLFTVFGPGQRPDMALARWIAALRRDEAIPWHVHRGGRRELTYVDDAARGSMAALERGHRGEAYNIAGSGSYSLVAVRRLIEAQLGRRARLLVRPPSAAEAVRTAACGAKSERELGYRPAFTLAEGVRRPLVADRPRAGGAPAPPAPAPEAAALAS